MVVQRIPAMTAGGSGIHAAMEPQKTGAGNVRLVGMGIKSR